jgi:hypothetical protein
MVIRYRHFGTTYRYHPQGSRNLRNKEILDFVILKDGHILRRNCLLKQVIEGRIKGEMEVTRRRGRRRKMLLDDLKDMRGEDTLI